MDLQKSQATSGTLIYCPWKNTFVNGKRRVEKLLFNNNGIYMIRIDLFNGIFQS